MAPGKNEVGSDSIFGEGVRAAGRNRARAMGFLRFDTLLDVNALRKVCGVDDIDKVS